MVSGIARGPLRGGAIALAVLLGLSGAGCGDAAPAQAESDTAEIGSVVPSVSFSPGRSFRSAEEENAVVTIALTVDGISFSATLGDTRAASELAQRLPLTLDMAELNGNEKYCYLDEPLSVDSSRVGTIHAGDIMLFGDDCLVLFYETFTTGYSYTRIGRIDDPMGFAEALGTGSVIVSFEAK